MINALKSLKRITFTAFLIILQLSIGLYMVNSSSVIRSSANSKLDSFNSLFDFNNTYFLTVLTYDTTAPKGTSISDDWSVFENIKPIYNKLLDLETSGIISRNTTYYTAGGGNPILSSPNDPLIPEKYKNISHSQFATYCGNITINKDFNDYFNIKIKEGRGFNESDFSKDYKKENIPMIIGLDYKDKIKIGDTFEYPTPNSDTTYSNINYEVIGFYDNNTMPCTGTGELIITDMIYSNSFVITPTIPEVIYSNEIVTLAQHGLYIELQNPSYISVVESELTPLLKEYGFTLKVQHLKEYYNKAAEVLVQSSINSSTLAFALIFLSVIGVTAIMIGEISKRSREFGIRISQGATIKILCLEIFYEILFMCILAGLASIIMTFIAHKSILTLTLILSNVIILIILSIVISLIPILKLRKLNVIDLLRGE